MASYQTFMQPRELSLRLRRFLTVGALGTLLDIGIFAVLSVVFHMAVLPANAIAYGAGIIHNYVLHRYWTYGDGPRKKAAVQFAQFAVIGISAMALNTGLVLLLATPFGTLFGSAHGDLIAKIFATGVGVGWNFLANHLWTFGAKKEAHI